MLFQLKEGDLVLSELYFGVYIKPIVVSLEFQIDQAFADHHLPAIFLLFQLETPFLQKVLVLIQPMDQSVEVRPLEAEGGSLLFQTQGGQFRGFFFFPFPGAFDPVKAVAPIVPADLYRNRIGRKGKHETVVPEMKLQMGGAIRCRHFQHGLRLVFFSNYLKSFGIDMVLFNKRSYEFLEISMLGTLRYFNVAFVQKGF